MKLYSSKIGLLLKHSFLSPINLNFCIFSFHFFSCDDFSFLKCSISTDAFVISQSLVITNDSTRLSVEDDFMKITPKKTIESLTKNKEVDPIIVVLYTIIC